MKNFDVDLTNSETLGLTDELLGFLKPRNHNSVKRIILIK